jgi:hypothetical protein
LCEGELGEKKRVGVWRSQLNPGTKKLKLNIPVFYKNKPFINNE